MKNRPATTLFMIMSLDGKISSGDTDNLDVDRDWKKIKGVKEGLQQYYDLEKKTDACFFISGKVLAKVGFNKKEKSENPIPVTSVIVDNKGHLKKKGLEYLSSWLKRVIIVTTSDKHIAENSEKNITVLKYKNKINFVKLFEKLKKDFEINRITIQSGGTLNTELLRSGLIDKLSIVVAPILVGGSKTSTLLDGESLHKVNELHKLKALKLKQCNKLKNSYLHLRYDVINKTEIDS